MTAVVLRLISISLSPLQLLSFLEKRGVDSEGILRVPGSQSRIKVRSFQNEQTLFSQSFISFLSLSWPWHILSIHIEGRNMTEKIAHRTTPIVY